MKPNLIIIGAMKSGTTSLHNYLQSHPDISMSEPKELNFFSNPKYWKRGTEWYESHFNGPATIRGETSTSYTTYPRSPDVAARMHGIVPEAKLIYLVRDPIDRFISHYVHHLAEGQERRRLSEVIRVVREGEESPYVAQGRYYFQLEHYLRHFDARQILVVTTEGLKSRREETLRDVSDFLELPYAFSEIDVSQEHNQSGTAQLARNWWVNLVYPPWLTRHSEIPWKFKSPFFRLAKLGGRVIEKPRLHDDEIAALVEIFRDDVRRLREFTGKSFPDWRDGFSGVSTGDAGGGLP